MTTGRRHPSGKRLFSEEQAQALIKAYDDGATQRSLCRVAEEMIGQPVSLSTIRNLLHGRSYKNLAAQVN
jgi:hypothetical protein